MDFSHQRTRNLDGRSTEVTSVATGALADRVRRRLGAPADTEVHLTEWHLVSGTDWTVEFETTFEVTAGDKSVVFVPDDANADDWSVGLGRPEGVRDTVYARFDAWLRAADDPAGLIADWFEPHETCDWWESWTVRPGTPLHTVAVRLGGGPRAVERVSLARIPERVAEDYRDRTKLSATDWVAWRLDTIAPARPDGFRAITHRRHFAVGEYDEYAGTVSPNALLEITDELMPGSTR